MILNKSFITNTIAVVFIAVAFLFPLEKIFSQALLYTGLFALSGALTNQLAVYMLFEKVPFLYGSGVIPLRFEAFKLAIKNLLMEQFFTQEQLDNFFQEEEKKIDLTPIIQESDFSPAYDALTKTVMDSSFGGMLGMFGGEKALEGLREPFTNKLKSAIMHIVTAPEFHATLNNHLKNSSLNDDMLQSIEGVIDTRLDEFTPQMVKEMVQKLIREHLEWLIVWGGVFGGVIGLISSFVL
ncbi:DUF445 domain-containing protein [Sulfurimonas sp. C5]|uniref:DUF445 domain-containing protein n=1 Tax=Sulfurimonas sp. C5 TaxID=3036947 RepID=UPI002455D212|nr:DUF445 domain-containing protein [Sulfurimonas sp. C5]MDH4943467.1 DUF445 domain-containing protein [Sulfurimonas sp. C5]